MTSRLFAHPLILLASCGLFIAAPYAALAATAGSAGQCQVDAGGNCSINGTSCVVITGNSGPTCYDMSAQTSYGTPNYTNTLDATNAKILGCNPGSTVIPNVGSTVALGGPYVPVSDAAVTKNTGYLVYKACVLDALAAELKKAVVAQLTTNTVKLVNQVNKGNPGFVQNIDTTYIDPALRDNTTEFFRELRNAQQNNPAPIDSSVIDTVEQQHQADVSGTDPSYAPSLNATDQQSFIHSTNTGGWGDWFAMAMNPNNNNLFQRLNIRSALDASNAHLAYNKMQLLIMGNGFAPIETTKEFPIGNSGQTAIVPWILTPGIAVSQTLGQAIGAGFDLAKNANSIDDLTLSTQSGLAAQMLSSPTGLAGLSQPTASSDGTASGPSYLDQMFQSVLNFIQKGTASGSGSGTPKSSSASDALTKAIATENQYLGYRRQVQTYLDGEVQILQNTQDSCWISLAQAVGTLAATTNTSFTVATSSIYVASSTADIITPVRNLMQQDIDHSTTTIAALQTMLVAVTANNTPATNQSVLDELDTLTANHTLHTTADLTAAQQNITDIGTAVSAKVDATIATWKTGPGWCNASSTDAVAAWLNQWKN